MSKYLITVYGHEIDRQSTESAGDDLGCARKQLAGLAYGALQRFGDLVAHPTITRFLERPEAREITVTRGGRPVFTYRVNHNERHCPTCRCNQRTSWGP